LKIFLAGSFRTEEDIKFLERIKKILTNEGNEIWCARDHIGDYYGTTQRNRLKEIIEIEKDEILKSDMVVAILKNLSPEPIIQAFYASEYDIPILLYLKLKKDEDTINFSPWIRYHVQIVKSENAFINAFRNIKNKIEKKYI